VDPSPDDVLQTCGSPPSPLCEWVFESTGSRAAAGLVRFLVGAPLRIVLVVVAAWVLAIVVRRLIRRSVNQLADAHDQQGRKGLRTETLGAVLTSTAAALIWFVAALTIVGSFGIQLSAFIAGASIIGGAIAFGAQQLVRDFLTGFFVLSEDQYGVGDVVDLGHATGVVEKVTLRTTRLRDVEGRVWHVPHGQVVRAGNLSHGWARSLLDVPVARWADVTAVIAELERIAGSLRADPVLGPMIIDDAEVLGVEQVLDDRYILRVIMKTRPGDQWTVSRRWRQEILAARHAGTVPFPEPVPSVLMRDQAKADAADEPTTQAPAPEE
jgi:moderate conductance mechanosensitive channel